jgi:aspartyl-tRNA(Asn)/glutamyl-tRNA(Gln) amidotransferase subunit B
MEEGSLRCDANISIRPKGQTELGVKAEVKNLNSFKAVQKALQYEADRQMKVLSEGGVIEQETRLWDEDKGVTRSMRSKEGSHDYRYFPDPDLVPLIVSDEWVEQMRSRLPELPAQRKERFQESYGLSEYDAGVLIASKHTAEFFEKATGLHADAKAVANWVMGDLQRYLNEQDIEITDCKITPESLAEMLELIADGAINGKIAKEVFAEMFKTGESPKAVVEAKGLTQITDESALAELVDKVIADNPDPVADFLGGAEKAFGFLMGQVMKASKGKANPKIAQGFLRDRLKDQS